MKNSEKREYLAAAIDELDSLIGDDLARHQYAQAAQRCEIAAMLYAWLDELENARVRQEP